MHTRKQPKRPDKYTIIKGILALVAHVVVAFVLFLLASLPYITLLL